VLDASRRLIFAVRVLAREDRIPKLLRGLVAFGLMPIPGPFDAAGLVVAGVILLAFYRRPLREAWTRPVNSRNPQPS
jgi:hypothetical protein